MDNIEAEATEYLAHTLGKFTFTKLTEEERHAAFMLVCTMPDGAVIKTSSLPRARVKLSAPACPLK